ncbi:MAG: hypothetical protein FWE10_02845 [Rikenellaceae bacterium]|nr:hypothetical protein [Rikenellaceae bacterium]MCL2693100.1 hypothetical protein [Rikenellaceae bacterium]
MKKLLFLPVFCLLALGACKEDRTPGDLYDGDNYIYLRQPVANPTNIESRSWMSPGTPGSENYIAQTRPHDVRIELRPLGFISSADRPVKIEFANKGAANFPPEAVFEVIPGLDELKIPANGHMQIFTVRLYHDVEIFRANPGAQWQIVLECRENEHFKVWPELIGGGISTPGLPLAQFVINITVPANYN